MTINASTIRCENDKKLYDRLLQDPLVTKVNEQIVKAEEDSPFSVRRRLLSTSVRLSPRMSPKLHNMAAECVDKLELDLLMGLHSYLVEPDVLDWGSELDVLVVNTDAGELLDRGGDWLFDQPHLSCAGRTAGLHDRALLDVGYAGGHAAHVFQAPRGR